MSLKIKLIPDNYGELQGTYSAELEESSQRSGLGRVEILEKLEKVDLLSKFREDVPDLLKLDGEEPIVLTSEESRKFLGISQRMWDNLLGLVTGMIEDDLPWERICPNLTQGDDLWDSNALFWGPDIGRIGAFLDRFPVKRRKKVRECPTVVAAFRRLLQETLEAVAPTRELVEVVEPQEALETVPEISPISHVTVTKPLLAAASPLVASLQTWPAGLPKDNRELVSMYGDVVAQHVNRICKIRSPEELEDVCQQMWIKLLEKDIVAKFMQACRTKLPRTMTLAESLAYLGIKHSQWVTAVTRNKADPEYWVPMPINGKRTSLEALYRTEDIKTLDETGFLPDRRILVRQRPEVSVRGFKPYLLKAVGNYFKNYVRTKIRRHKERPADPRNVYANDGVGVYHKVSSIEDGGSWEDSLSINELSAEGMCDLVCNLKKYGVDPRSAEGIAVLDYMTQGYDIKEALKAQVRAYNRQKALEVAGATVPA